MGFPSLELLDVFLKELHFVNFVVEPGQESSFFGNPGLLFPSLLWEFGWLQRVDLFQELANVPSDHEAHFVTCIHNLFLLVIINSSNWEMRGFLSTNVSSAMILHLTK